MERENTDEFSVTVSKAICRLAGLDTITVGEFKWLKSLDERTLTLSDCNRVRSLWWNHVVDPARKANKAQ